jgi:hypothetical protein
MCREPHYVREGLFKFLHNYDIMIFYGNDFEPKRGKPKGQYNETHDQILYLQIFII